MVAYVYPLLGVLFPGLSTFIPLLYIKRDELMGRVTRWEM